MVVFVKNGNVQRSLQQIKRKLRRSGRDRDLARKASFIKPSEQRRANHRRAVKRMRKMEDRNGT
jgi:small subunit ribosomal protein S21